MRLLKVKKRSNINNIEHWNFHGKQPILKGQWLWYQNAAMKYYWGERLEHPEVVLITPKYGEPK